jgi:hypothetical protein
MHCSIKYWPVEIVVLTLQHIQSNKDLISFVQAVPELLHIFILKEYLCSRIHHKVCLSKYGIVRSNWMDLQLFSSLEIGNDFKSMKSLVKQGIGSKFAITPFNSIKKLDRLQKLHIQHHNGIFMTEIIHNIPSSVIVFELIITGPLKGTPSSEKLIRQNFWRNQLYNSREKTSKLSLKMITIINKNKWNQKKICRNFGITVGSIKKLVKQGYEKEQDILLNDMLKICSINSTLLFLGYELAMMIKKSDKSIQNIGIFGIDATWILYQDIISKGYYSQLRIIKLSVESTSRINLWCPIFLSMSNQQRTEFKNGIMLKPMIVIFSKLFGKQCKVIYGDLNKVSLVGGTGIEMFKKYTFLEI